MAWVVTLKVTDCGTNALLPGAFITDGTSTGYADANAQFVAVINDVYTDYGVNIGKADYHTKNFIMNRANHAGTIQTVCLNRKPPSSGGSGSTGDGW